ncbi:MAG: hypothetical protein Q9191_004651 [Dirinaria sp. TL-2023a]
MKTSRLAKDTAKVAKNLSEADYVPRRQTRSFAASLQAFSANGITVREAAKTEVKEEDLSHDESSLSSLSSAPSLDIEDSVPTNLSRSRKRKHGLDTPTTTVASISATTSVRSTPRKPVANGKDGKIKKAKRQPAKQSINDAGEVEIHPPANWAEIYDSVKEMRKTAIAPVDTMGCETLAEEHLTARDKRFQTLIALMLSSQTKDTTNAIAMRKLQTELPHPGLTLENILAVDPVKLNELIYVVGFHNNKTRYIKATAPILRDQYGGDIPSTVEGLMSLPGVGPKMAYLCMSAAWGKTVGIGVDVHVHRITNLWAWHKTKAPEETRLMLEAWLPREKWHEINHLLVGFGQTICLPIGRKCGECQLSEKGLCPSAVVDRRKKMVKKIKKEIAEGDDGAVDEKTEETTIIKEENQTIGDEI